MPTKPLTVLWSSNAPWTGSGYGTQTATFSLLMKEYGIEPIIFGFWGHRSAVMQWNGITVLPGSFDEFGNDILEAHWKHYKPDVTVALVDIWVIQNAVLDKVPVTAWAPVDHDPIPPAVADHLGHARWQWAMSRFGERQMRKVGIDPFYVPHGIDTGVFTPRDRAKARQQWNTADDRFLAVMVAANKGYPSRKSLDKVLKAWSVFTRTHPNSTLYIHTEPRGVIQGVDLRAACDFYECDLETVRFPDEYRMMRGDYSPAMLANLYSAADVLLAPSEGEGFGIPVVEAQACGCPAVVTGATAQTELCFGGHVIEVDRLDGMKWSPMGSEYADPKPSQILAGLEWAYEQRGNKALREAAHAGAQEYDARHVFTRYMLPALETIAEYERDARREQEAREGAQYRIAPQPRWAKVGLFNPDGSMSIPSLDTDDELVVYPNGGQRVIQGGYAPVVNGIDLHGIEDDPEGAVWRIVCRELQRDAYGIEGVPFEAGDRVVDIGGHVGVVSIYLALRYPQIERITAYEPNPANLERLMRNIRRFGLADRIWVSDHAVTADGRDVLFETDTHNSGGGHLSPNGSGKPTPSLSIQRVLQDNPRFIKIDCEGAEYEIFDALTDDELARIPYMGAEFHWTNGQPSPDELATRIKAAGVQLAYTATGAPRKDEVAA